MKLSEQIGNSTGVIHLNSPDGSTDNVCGGGRDLLCMAAHACNDWQLDITKWIIIIIHLTRIILTCPAAAIAADTS